MAKKSKDEIVAKADAAWNRRVSPGDAQLVAAALPAPKWDGELTNSARTCFWNCRRKFAWQYLHRLSPRTPSVPLVVGSLFHWGLEQMYTKGEFDEAASRAYVTREIEKASVQAAVAPELSDKLWAQQAIVMGALKGYAALYLERDLKEWEIVEVEQSFAYPLQNGWNARGKRDMVVRHKKTKKIFLTEHKTAAYIDANYIAKLPLDSQILNYALSLKKKTGKLPDGILYNVTKKSALRLKQSETLEQYYQRIEEEYLNNPSMYFYRELLSFTDKDLINFERELNLFAREMARAIDEGYFYKNTTHCTALGVCPYMRLCVDGPTQENLLHYRVREAVHEELTEEASTNGN